MGSCNIHLFCCLLSNYEYFISFHKHLPNKGDSIHFKSPLINIYVEFTVSSTSDSHVLPVIIMSRCRREDKSRVRIKKKKRKKYKKAEEKLLLLVEIKAIF